MGDEKIGCDSDRDDAVDAAWEEIQKEGLTGESPTQEEWDRWAAEANERKKAKDGNAGEVQSH
jgi:hypothetical protein